MPDTNINAFYMDVDEKKKAVEQAKAELQTAEVRLTDKKRVDGVEDEPIKETKPAHVDARARKSSEDKKVLQGTARNPSFTSKGDHKNV